MTNTAAPNTSLPDTGVRKHRTDQEQAVVTAQTANRQAGLDPQEVELLVQGRHHDPHSLLGRHGGLVRALRPAASEMYVLVTGAGARPGDPAAGGRCAKSTRPGCGKATSTRRAAGYRLEAIYGAAGSPGFVFDDPYRLWPTLGDLDLHLFNEGRHHRLWEVLGAHPRTHQGVAGTAFAVWAPNAKAVRVVGDWNFWDGRLHPMRALGGSGVWELFIPGAHAGRALQVRAGDRGRTPHFEGGPARFRHRGPSRHGVGDRRAAGSQLGRRWLDGQEGRRATPWPSRCPFTRSTWAHGGGPPAARAGPGRCHIWSWPNSCPST